MARLARTAQSAPATILVGRHPQNVTRKIQKNLTGSVNLSGGTSEKGTPGPTKGVCKVEGAWAWIALRLAVTLRQERRQAAAGPDPQ